MRQQRRALALAWSAAGSLLLLAVVAGFFYIRAQESELETRRQAAGTNYRSALQEQQQGFDEAALAYLAKAERLDPENANIGTAILMLLANRYWPSLAVSDLSHRDIVNSARFSPDGTLVVTASADRTAAIWDARTGRQLVGPLVHQDIVFGAKFNLSGNRVVTWANDNTARLWDARTGKPIGEPLPHRGWVTSADFTRDGMRLVTGAFDCTAQVWDVRTGERIGPPLHHQGWVDSVEFTRSGHRVVTSSDLSAQGESGHLPTDSNCRACRCRSGRGRCKRPADRSPHAAPERRQDGTRAAERARIVTASNDGTAHVWDAD